MKKFNKDVCIVLLEELYRPATKKPEKSECGACLGFAQNHTCLADPAIGAHSFSFPYIDDDAWKERNAQGIMLAYGGPEKNRASDYNVCAFEFESDHVGDDISSLGIAEDFNECKKTGLYYWEGEISYCSGNCFYDSPCDCGPTLIPDFIRPVTVKDLRDFDLFVEGKFK